MNFSWTAYYNDNSKLNQFEGEKENKYTDIRRKELKAFALCQVNTGEPHVTVYFDRPTQRLILRRRITSDFSALGGVEGKATLTPRSIIWIVGWQELVGDKNVQLLLFLYEDGTVAAMPRYGKHADFTPVDTSLEDRLDGYGKKKS